MLKKSGFTLIELLVVIAIIALLLSILIPSLGKAKDRTRTILCRSNLRQYGLAMKMYLDDNKAYFPTYNIWLKRTSATGNFLMEKDHPDGVFWPYISSFDIHLCPVFPKILKGTAWERTYNGTQVRGNYSMNSYLGNHGAIWSSWLGAGVTGVLKESEVTRPSGVAVFVEENPWTISLYSNYPLNDLHFTVGNANTQIDNFGTFHNAAGTSYDDPKKGLNMGGSNLVFVDGHVEFLPRLATKEDLDHGFRLCWPKRSVK